MRDALEIVPVEHIDQVLTHALVLDDPSEFFHPAATAVDDDDGSGAPAPM